MSPKAEQVDRASGFMEIFIRRPILAIVFNCLIVLAGIAAALTIEVRELPDVDQPVISIDTDLSGASPETMDREVTAIIEGAVARVPGVDVIASRSKFGESDVTAVFRTDVDIDVAASDARDAISRVRGNLPDGVDEPRIVKADSDSDAVMRIGLTSSTRSPQDLTVLAEDLVIDRLVSVPGVADVQVYGGRDRIFRVDVDQLALASRGLTLGDVRRALANIAFDSPAGALTASNQRLVVRTTATVETAEGFEALLLNAHTRLGDVASVTLGPDISESTVRSNGVQGIGLGILRQAQSNALEISAGVTSVVEQLAASLPPDVEIFITSDDARFIKGSIREVLLTLGFAVAIVVAIIFLFLRDWSATMIPAVTIPVALVGTVAAIHLTGFSINILTLLAMVLAAGLVVDDAIVVLENIVRWRARGLGPRAAAVLGTRQVFFAVVATTTTLIAVFVPLSFLPGQTGALFREFGITLALAVALSSIVALSLCPMLASRMLRAPSEEAERAPSLVERAGAAMVEAYRRALHWALGAPLVVWTFAALVTVLAGLIFSSIPREMTPTEDRSLVLARVTAPQGVSRDYTVARMRDFEQRLAHLRASGEIVGSFSVSGTGQGNGGFMALTLADWGERARSQQEIAAEVRRIAGGVAGLDVMIIQPNSLRIRGAGQGLQVGVVGNDYAVLAETAERIRAEMQANPAFGQVRISYETTQPQLFIEVDRARASDLGIDIDGLGEAMRAALDGASIGSVFIGDRSHDIKLVSTTNPVRDPSDLEGLFLQTGAGEMVPMSTVVSLEERAIAPELNRETQMRAVSLTADLAAGVSLSEAFEIVRELGEPLLVADTALVPLGEMATLDESSRALMLTFGFAILVVFLVLSAQFESFTSAVIIMITVPLGLACAVIAMQLSGTSLNVYSQIGLVLLVGIMAKNGILIVEFANQLRDTGESLRDSIEHACLIRLRPVMMTMSSTVLGAVPLVLSTGAGAEAREALGWIIVGGLGLATMLTLFLTPVAYLALAGLSKARSEEASLLEAELAAASGAQLRDGRPA